MTQPLATDFPIDPTTTSGTALADILNRFAGSVGTSNSGATAPASTQPGMLWYDTSTNPPVLRIRNAANTGWNAIAVSGASAPFMLPDGSAAAPALAYTNEPTLGLYRSSAGQFSLAAGGKVTAVFDFSTPGSMLSILPKANAAASVSLRNQVAGVVAFSQTILQQNADGSGTLGVYNNLGAAAGQLFIHVGGITNMGTVNGGAIVGQTIGIAPGVTMSQDAGYVYDQYAVGWYWAFNKNNGSLQWTRPGGNPATILAENGNFITGGNALICGVYTDKFGLLQDASNWYFRLSDATHLSVAKTSGDMNYTVNTQWAFSSKGASGDFWIRGQAYKPGGGVWGDASDERIKDNIEDYTVGLDAVLQLRPRTYTYKAETERNPDIAYVGLIAQEAEAVMPDMVKSAPGAIGSLEFEDLRTIDTSALVYALINAVRDVHERVSTLETMQ